MLHVGDSVRVTQGGWAGCTGFIEEVRSEKAISKVQLDDDELCWFYNYKLQKINTERGIMNIQEAVRKSFPVQVVQVSLENIEEVAKWCGGTVEQRPTTMLGASVNLPTIILKGQSTNRAIDKEASIGCWVVKLKENFRSYRSPQFDASFDIVEVKTDAEGTPELLQEAEEHEAKFNSTIDPGQELAI